MLSTSSVSMKSLAYKEFNRLKNVAVSQGALSTQIMFDFTQPFYFEKRVVPEKSQVKLYFPGMSLECFNKSDVVTKIQTLKEQGLLKNVYIREKNKNIPKVVLTLTFAKYRKDKDAEGNNIDRKNALIIKWSKVDEAHRLVLDIFEEKSLEVIKKSNSVILQAHNNSLSPQNLLVSNNPLFIPRRYKKKRVIVSNESGIRGKKKGLRLTT